MKSKWFVVLSVLAMALALRYPRALLQFRRRKAAHCSLWVKAKGRFRSFHGPATSSVVRPILLTIG